MRIKPKTILRSPHNKTPIRNSIHNKDPNKFNCPSIMHSTTTCIILQVQLEHSQLHITLKLPQLLKTHLYLTNTKLDNSNTKQFFTHIRKGTYIFTQNN
jgi:hypothetical protein